MPAFFASLSNKITSPNSENLFRNKPLVENSVQLYKMKIDKEQIVNKSLGSMKWASLGMILPKLLSPIVTVWLANILDPAAFGVVALASVIIGFSNLIQGLGFSEYIIKEQKLDDNKLSVAFFSNLLIGIIIYLIIAALTPLFSKLYHNVEISSVLLILSLLIIINSLGVVQYALLQKNMLFKKIFFIQLLPIIVLVGVTLPLALLGYGVWSLVIGQLAKGILANLLYWIFSSWHPKIYFALPVFLKMFNFGKWVTIEKIEEYIYGNMDIILIGIFFDLKATGLYSIAKYIINITYTTFNGPIGAVIYPMFSKLHGSLDELKNGFLSVSKKIFFINVPIMFGILTISYKIIPVLFENKWEGLPLLLSIIVLGEGAHRNIWAQREIFKVLNKPDIYPKSIIINLVFAIVFYYLLGRSSLIAFSIIKVVNDFIYVIVQLKLTTKTLNFSIRRLFIIIINPVIASIIMSTALLGAIFLLDKNMVNFNLVISFLLIIYGVSIYFISSYLINKNEFISLVNNAKVIVGIK